MLKNLSRLECIVDGKTGHFYLDSDTPLPVVKEMLFQFNKFIGQIEENVRAQQEAEKAKEPQEEAKE